MTQPSGPFGLEAFSLEGKTALVTGAAGLLGPEHGAALAELGARVILTDVRAEALEGARARLAGEGHERVETLLLDVTDEASIKRALAAAGRVDILVNNAAVDPKVGPEGRTLELSRLENLPLSVFEAEVRIGLTGAFSCARIFGAPMAERGEGVILNIASDLSVIAPDQRLYRKPGLADQDQPVKPVTYSVIKTGLVGLTRYLATYWADRGVRVNALSPGGVEAGQDEAFVSRLTNLIPQGRMARRSEYRAAVQFLCSPASAYMTGQNLVMDGGRSVL